MPHRDPAGPLPDPPEEVISEPVRAEAEFKDCKDCSVVALLGFRMIYTRPKRASLEQTTPITTSKPESFR